MNKPTCLINEHIIFLDNMWSYGIRIIESDSLEYAFGLSKSEAKLVYEYWKDLRNENGR